MAIRAKKNRLFRVSEEAAIGKRRSLIKESVKSIDKIRKSIGDDIFDHIASLNEEDALDQLEDLEQELSRLEKEYGSKVVHQGYYQRLKDEEWFLQYRLGM